MLPASRKVAPCRFIRSACAAEEESLLVALMVVVVPILRLLAVGLAVVFAIATSGSIFRREIINLILRFKLNEICHLEPQ